jgi:hypothetical protein
MKNGPEVVNLTFHQQIFFGCTSGGHILIPALED